MSWDRSIIIPWFHNYKNRSRVGEASSLSAQARVSTYLRRSLLLRVRLNCLLENKSKLRHDTSKTRHFVFSLERQALFNKDTSSLVNKVGGWKCSILSGLDNGKYLILHNLRALCPLSIGNSCWRISKARISDLPSCWKIRFRKCKWNSLEEILSYMMIVVSNAINFCSFELTLDKHD